MFEISSIYSLWWMLPVIILSIALSALLYFKNSKEEFSNWVNFLLASFRFIVFSVLGFLLLSPLLISWQTKVEKAKIIIVTDDSKSMTLWGEQDKLKEYNNSILEKLNKGFSEKFDIINYSFGNNIKIKTEENTYSNLRTNINGAIKSISEKYKYNNIGAIVFLSDGIYNVGNNPIYSIKYSKFPVYTLGFGDTIMHHDIAIEKVLVNKTVFIKNKFPMEVSVSAKMLKGKKSKLIVTSNGKTIHTYVLNFDSNNDFLKHRFFIEEKNSGFKTYKIYIQEIDNERNILNNIARANVEVLGSKKKVLLLYTSPHPDVAALQHSIKKSEEYELEISNVYKFKKDIKDYSLIIMHQIPDNNVRSVSIINKMKIEGIPALWILGAKSGIHFFNAMKVGISIKSKKQSFIESTSIVNTDFAEFVIPKNLANQISLYPPLYSPYGRYKTYNSIRTIFYQQIGSVATKYPQVCISENSGKRSAFILGEGIWRWRLYDFMENNSHINFDSFILKLIRYVSIQKNIKRFDVQHKAQYKEFDDVVFNAQFYNASYEALNNVVIDLVISNQDSNKYNFSFSNDGHLYSVSAGRLPRGEYTYKAVVKYNNKKFIKRGKFYVDGVELEGTNLLANHDLLRKMALKSNAEFYISDNYKYLIDDINNREDIVNIETQTLEYKDIINYPIIMILLILIMSVEWFIRKQMGSY